MHIKASLLLGHVIELLLNLLAQLSVSLQSPQIVFISLDATNDCVKVLSNQQVWAHSDATSSSIVQCFAAGHAQSY